MVESSSICSLALVVGGVRTAVVGHAWDSLLGVARAEPAQRERDDGLVSSSISIETASCSVHHDEDLRGHADDRLRGERGRHGRERRRGDARRGWSPRCRRRRAPARAGRPRGSAAPWPKTILKTSRFSLREAAEGGVGRAHLLDGIGRRAARASSIVALRRATVSSTTASKSASLVAKWR